MPRRSAPTASSPRSTKDPKFQVVASVPGNWDRQLSYDDATNILQQHPDLIGFYCNNDTMALGVVEAVKSARASPARSRCSAPTASRTPMPRSAPAN